MKGKTPMQKCRAKAPRKEDVELAVVMRTGDNGSRVILGTLRDPQLLRAALERLVDGANLGAAKAGDPLVARACFAQGRVFREMLSGL